MISRVRGIIVPAVAILGMVPAIGSAAEVTQSVDATTQSVAAATSGTLVTDSLAPASRAGNNNTDDFSDFSDLSLDALLNIEVDVGSAFSESIDNIPAIVQVFTASDIRRLGIRDLRELLLHFAGFFETAAITTPFLTRGVDIRGGATSSRVMILVDGHPLLDAIDEIYEPYGIPIDAIQQAEFLRGPAAILYGSSAMGGVLNLRLRKPDDTSGSVFISGDPLRIAGEAAGQAEFASDKSDWQVSADVQVRQTEDRQIFFDKDDFGQSGQFSAQARYVSSILTFHHGNTRLRLRQHEVVSGWQGISYVFATEADDGDLTLLGADFRHVQPAGDRWEITVKGGFDGRDRNMDLGIFPITELPPTPVFSGRTLDEHRTTIKQRDYVSVGSIQGAASWDSWRLTVGADYRHLWMADQRFEFNDDGADHPFGSPPGADIQMHDVNAFAQADIYMHDDVALLSGIRLNTFIPRAKNIEATLPDPDDQRPAPTVSPMARGALVWHAVDSTTFKLLYGRSFRLPTGLEMFNSAAGFLVPNPKLGPGLQDTLEVVASSNVLEQLYFQIDLFQFWVHDQIEFIVQPDVLQGGFDNLGGTSLVRGVESEFRWIPADWLDTQLSFTFQEGFETDKRYNRRIPRVIGKLWSSFRPLQNETLVITPKYRYRGRSGTRGSDSIVDAVITSRPVDWLQLSVSAINIANEPETMNIAVIPGVGDRYGELIESRALRIGVRADF